MNAAWNYCLKMQPVIIDLPRKPDFLFIWAGTLRKTLKLFDYLIIKSMILLDYHCKVGWVRCILLLFLPYIYAPEGQKTFSVIPNWLLLTPVLVSTVKSPFLKPWTWRHHPRHHPRKSRKRGLARAMKSPP